MHCQLYGEKIYTQCCQLCTTRFGYRIAFKSNHAEYSYVMKPSFNRPAQGYFRMFI